jgi:D-alanyl-D-alanine dipeptidase
LRSYTHSAAISSDQKRSRGILLAAMSRHGFKNYFREWWHFYLKTPRLEYLDFPIPPRRH